MTYAELQSAIGDWLMRQDLTSVIPTFIDLAEARFNREMRVRRMITTATLTLADGKATLPSDWLESRNVRYVDDPYRSLEYVTLEAADDIRETLATATDQFTIRGDQIEFIAAPDDGTEIELTYYAEIPALSDSNTSNWLSTRWPDVYLYGALMHSAPYLKDDERVAVWAGLHDRALEEIRMEDHKAQWSGSTLKIRSRALG
jgi:hypothetical protein